MDQDLNDLVKVDQYRRCINLLQKRCEFIQKENERLVHRMYIVKKITKRRNREISMLKNRLDLYNDSWRTAQPDPLPNLEKLDNVALQSENQINESNAKGATTGKGAPKKQKGKKVKEEKLDANGKPIKKKRRTDKEKDPNAPKRPANPFFQFCQDQRSTIMDEMNSELQPGEPEPSKQELTRQLAQRWRTMDNNKKQIYINMYENSKQKYNQDMLQYKDSLDKDKRMFPLQTGPPM